MNISSITLFTIFMLLSGYSLAADNQDNHDHDDAHSHSHSEKHEHPGDQDHSQHEDYNDEAHADESQPHDDHDHSHNEDAEERTEISPEAAKAAGIHISNVKPARIKQILSLTGRIILNRNTTADVRARFPGIVKQVDVNWGDLVKKGQVLAVIEANESLRTYQVKAPSDGILLNRNTNVGNVTGEAPIFTVADLSVVWAEFHVFSRDLSKVKLNQSVRVHTLENDREQFTQVRMVLPTADALSQTVVAIVEIENHQNQWRPGMTVEGDVMVSEEEVTMAVSEHAIQRMENQTVVFVKEGNTYEMRPVTLGIGDGDYIEVKSGLSIGEQYVSQGSFIVKADVGKSEAEHQH